MRARASGFEFKWALLPFEPKMLRPPKTIDLSYTRLFEIRAGQTNSNRVVRAGFLYKVWDSGFP